MDVEFAEPGALGLKFTPNKQTKNVEVLAINPGTQAERHPQLRPGLVLTEVGGESVTGIGYPPTLALIKKAGRPVTLRFTSGGTVASAVASSPQSVVKEPELAGQDAAKALQEHIRTKGVGDIQTINRLRRQSLQPPISKPSVQSAVQPAVLTVQEEMARAAADIDTSPPQSKPDDVTPVSRVCVEAVEQPPHVFRNPGPIGISWKWVSTFGPAGGESTEMAIVDSVKSGSQADMAGVTLGLAVSHIEGGARGSANYVEKHSLAGLSFRTVIQQIKQAPRPLKLYFSCKVTSEVVSPTSTVQTNDATAEIEALKEQLRAEQDLRHKAESQAASHAQSAASVVTEKADLRAKLESEQELRRKAESQAGSHAQIATSVTAEKEDLLAQLQSEQELRRTAESLAQTATSVAAEEEDLSARLQDEQELRRKAESQAESHAQTVASVAAEKDDLLAQLQSEQELRHKAEKQLVLHSESKAAGAGAADNLLEDRDKHLAGLETELASSKAELQTLRDERAGHTESVSNLTMEIGRLQTEHQREIFVLKAARETATEERDHANAEKQEEGQLRVAYELQASEQREFIQQANEEALGLLRGVEEERDALKSELAQERLEGEQKLHELEAMIQAAQSSERDATAVLEAKLSAAQETAEQELADAQAIIKNSLQSMEAARTASIEEHTAVVNALKQEAEARENEHISAAKVQSWYRSQSSRRVMKDMIGHHSQHIGDRQQQIQALESSVAERAQELQVTRNSFSNEQSELIAAHIADLAAEKESAAREIDAAQSAHLESLAMLEATAAAEREGHAAVVRSLQESAALSIAETGNQHISAAKIQSSYKTQSTRRLRQQDSAVIHARWSDERSQYRETIESLKAELVANKQSADAKLQNQRARSNAEQSELIAAHIAALAAAKESAASEIDAAQNAHLQSLATLEASMAAEREGHAAVLLALKEEHQEHRNSAIRSGRHALMEHEQQHVSAAKVQSWYRSQLARRVMKEMIRAHVRSRQGYAGQLDAIHRQHEEELDAAELEVAEWQSKLQQKHAEGLQGMLRVRAEDDVKLKAMRGEAQAWEQAYHQQRNMAEQHSIELAQFKVQCASQLQRIQKEAASPRTAGFASPLASRNSPGGRLRTPGTGQREPLREGDQDTDTASTLEERLEEAGLGALEKPLTEAGYDALDLMQEMNDADWTELVEELGSAIDEQSLQELRACVAGVNRRAGVANNTAAAEIGADASSPRRDLAADLASITQVQDANETVEQMAEKLRVAERLLAEAIRAKTDAEAGAEARTRALQVENVQLKRDQMQLKSDLSRKVDSYLLELI